MAVLSDLPAFALSLRQPWAWLIVEGFKDIENRSWRASFRGPVLIHASAKMDADDREVAEALMLGQHPASGAKLDPEIERRAQSEPWQRRRGGIVGFAHIADCVDQSDSPWFFGKWGFVITNPHPLPFRACRGALGFFIPDYSAAPKAQK